MNEYSLETSYRCFGFLTLGENIFSSIAWTLYLEGKLLYALTVRVISFYGFLLFLSDGCHKRMSPFQFCARLCVGLCVCMCERACAG